MKQTGWVPAVPTANSSRKKGAIRTIDQILKASYRLYARDRASQKAVKACLG